MKMKNERKSFFKLLYIALASCLLAACNDNDIDNTYSRNNFSIAMSASSDYVVLNENAPDEVALTVEWTPATDYGYDFITTYQYQVELAGSKAEAIKEYEDNGVFKRSYTNKQLQEILINDFKQLTSTTGNLKFTINASFEGPRLMVPDMSSITVKVKTYGDKQFLADKVFMAGTAVGENDMVLTVSSNNANLYVYNGKLSAGKINFPVLYGDEENAISPVSADMDITSDAMDATMLDRKEAHSWIIPEEDNYRVTVNFSNRTVTIIPAGDIIEVDKIYLAGTATNGMSEEETEVTQTLENESLYAFRGELKAGKLYLPILFNEQKAVSIVPNGNSHEISDGVAVNFAQASTEASTDSKYWEIPEDGTYRIVVDTDLKMITIYSQATDLLPLKVGPWNNTVIGDKEFYSLVEGLWMWGTFNSYAHDLNSDFQEKYKLVQSLASPYVFVYKGTALPRETPKESKLDALVPVIRFCASNIKNNVWAYGADINNATSASWKYLSAKNGEVQLGKEIKIVGGQGNNRYAYFEIPEKTNYVMVDIEKMIVVFDAK